jgi:hypothetical protein
VRKDTWPCRVRRERKWEEGGGRWEVGGGRWWEVGDGGGRREEGSGRWKVEGGRWDGGKKKKMVPCNTLDQKKHMACCGGGEGAGRVIGVPFLRMMLQQAMGVLFVGF